MTSRRPVTIMHVLHHMVIGGMENGVVNLVNHLPHERFRHVIVCIEDYSDFIQRIRRDDVKVVALHRSQVGAWRLRWELFRHMRAVKPDVVHTRNLSGLDALLPAKLLGLRTLHSEHGFDVDNLKGRSARPILLRRLHAPLVDRFICVSRDIADLMQFRWGIDSRRTTQIYNGVDTERFAPRTPARADDLRAVDRADAEIVIGTVGRVRPIKDHMTLLEAFAHVISTHGALRARLKLMVVGDGPLLGALKSRAASLGISDRCEFPGARHDIDSLMPRFDLFVLPSLNEGISNTVLEALACGIPVLATAVGGNVELVEAGVVGALFQPGDIGALATHIVRYAEDADLRLTQGQAARRRAVERFSLSAMVRSYQHAYEDLADRPAA